MDITVNSENEIVTSEQVQQSKTLNKMNLLDQKAMCERNIASMQANLAVVEEQLAMFDSPEVTAAISAYVDAQKPIVIKDPVQPVVPNP